MVRPFRFGLSAKPSSRAHWVELARKTEDLGYATLLTADHLGSASALAPLLVAAQETRELRLGTFVLNTEFFHPLRLAQELATIDQLSEGRFEAGLGSGWAKPEYELLGLDYDPAPTRAARLEETLEMIEAALAPETRFTLPGAGRAVAEPIQRPLPLLVGGHGDRILEAAARHAHIIGLTGVTWQRTRLLPTGVSKQAIAERIAFVKAHAGPRFDSLELNCLVQATHVADDASDARAAVAKRFGLEPEVLDESPFVMIGSTQRLVEKLLALREELGTSYFVVFEPALDAFAPVVAELGGR